jgi:hypothetical protein
MEVIAPCALACGLTLVINNAKGFCRGEGLKVENRAAKD